MKTQTVALVAVSLLIAMFLFVHLGRGTVAIEWLPFPLGYNGSPDQKVGVPFNVAWGVP